MAELSAAGQGVDRPDAASGSLPPASAAGRCSLAGNLQTAVDVPETASRHCWSRHMLGDFGEGIIVFEGLDPQAGEAGGDVLRSNLLLVLLPVADLVKLGRQLLADPLTEGLLDKLAGIAA